jgi:acyl carrier protein
MIHTESAEVSPMDGNHYEHQAPPPPPSRLDRDVVEEVLLAELAEFSAIPRSDLKPGTRIVDELALDSLEMVELAVRIEERWGVSLRAEDVDSLRTIRDISEAIVSRAE